MATKRYEPATTDRDDAPAEPQYGDVPSSSATPSSGEEPRDADPESGEGEIDGDEVARRAYERYRLRGEEHGHDQQDWFEAEREMRNERRQKPQPPKP